MFVNTNAQVQNGFMENWTPTQLGGLGEEPTGWATTNIVSSFLLGGNPVSVFKVTDSYSGFAAKIKTIKQTNNQTSGALDDTTGFMLLGSLTSTGDLIPVPYNYPTRPNSLMFRSKYIPNGGDTAGVGIAMFKWNTTLNKRDTIGEGFYTVGATQNTYVLCTANITYYVPSVVPDSMIIIAAASIKEPSTGQYPKVGSEFFVDHFHFDITAGIDDNENVSTFVTVYPNPSTFAVNFKFEAEQPKAILIYDMQGRVIENVSVQSSNHTLSTENWPKGLYTYSLLGNDNAVLKTGKFQVQ
jgi:hypothetical protein